ncbi:MAG: FAD-linked oxidoreductase [Deltaproteobacteria bacterium]|jgi:FAD-linked oxidoreductase|nr:FAD-linked oxidoreductase [Deltaproteobacteria bacterium]
MKEFTRRELLHAAALAAATGFLPGCSPTSLGPSPEELPGYEPGKALPWRNWGGNQGCRPALRGAPSSEDELAELLRSAPGVIRPVGTGHSFSALVPSDGTLVACDLMSGVIAADRERREAEVWAGTRLHQLGPALQAQGQAMPNLPDIDYQTLAGAVATSTHGTGPRFGSLSSTVRGLTLVTPRGEIIGCSRETNPEIFDAARCSLGALGVVSRMTLANQASFDLTETTSFEPLGDLLDDVEARRDRHRHFELYAFPHTEAGMAIATDEGRGEPSPTPEFEGDPLKMARDAFRKVGGLPLVGSALYEALVLRVADMPASVRSGPSYTVLTHPRITRFREMEYTVPAEAGPLCLREILDTIRRDRIPVVFPIEYRYVRRDELWLSMFHERDGCTISLHQFVDEDYRPYFDAMERIFRKYEGRPHWGKLHGLSAAELRGLYPRWQDFLEVRESLDPEGRMLNEHLRGVFGQSA